MATSFAVERMGQRTPWGPEGFLHLNRPKASRVFTVPGGRVHFFTGPDYRRHLLALKEYAVRLDMAAFKIDYWDAMVEVTYNMKREGTVSAAFFEPDESLITTLPEPPSEKGKERVLSSVLNRLTFSLANPFSRPNLRVEPSDVIEPESILDYPFVGYSTEETWKMNTDLGNLTVMYFSTIAGMPRVTGKGMMGPALFQVPYNMYQPDIIAFRVQNGVPISAMEKAGIGEGEREVIGVDKEWDDPLLKTSLGGLFDKRTRHPNGIDMDTLIARAVYPEGENRAYKHDSAHGRVLEASKKLISRGVEPKNGDGAYIAVWGKGKKEQREIGRQRLFVVPSLITPRLEVT